MIQKLKLGDQEYEVDNLSKQAKSTFLLYQFANQKIHELKNLQAVLQRSKNSYIESLKKEMLSQKAGLSLEEE